MTLTFGSLFAGIGGVDLALERAGMHCAFQVESDPACRAVLARHWPDVPRYDDVRTVGRHNLPAVDVLAGGWPCQDLSVAGHRAGLGGQRSGLWWEFHRLIAELAPSWVLAENVPGLFSSWTPVDDPPSGMGHGQRWEVDERNDFAIVVASLVELGYGVAWRVADAQHFGVPQRRRRIFFVGHRGTPWSAAASVLFEPESCSGNPEPRRETAPRDTGDVATGASLSLSLSENQRAEVRMTEVARQLTTGGGKPGQGYPAVVSTLQGGGKRGHRVDAETAAGGGLGRLMTGADDNDAQGNRLVVMQMTPRERERERRFLRSRRAPGAIACPPDTTGTDS